ncbi:MAG TPA: DUF362 domain-containing protein [Thermomicrobiales bacterium]|nr:DUF362 domain-containing protein [Thermomicrobiales bacterium]
MDSILTPSQRPYRVALTRVETSPDDAMTRAFDLLGDAPALAERATGLVTIKPNLTAPRPSGSGVVTDVAVVAAFVRLLRERAPGVQRIVVADGPGMVDTARCFEAAGYASLRDLGVELLDLNAAPTRPAPVAGSLRYARLEIPEIVLDADLFVSITPPKTHTDGLYTLHAKNMYGVPPTRFYGRPRRAFHRAGVSEVVHDICRARPIDLAITDATVGTQLGDPINGEPVPLNALAVGWNAQAVDIVSCALMRVDPRRSAYLQYLRAAGYGPLSLDEVELLGDDLNELSRPFAVPVAEDRKAQAASAH